VALMARNYWEIRGAKDWGKRSLMARYLFAAEMCQDFELPAITDVGCGYGYGSQLLAVRAQRVVGIDSDEDAIAKASRWNALDNLYFEHTKFRVADDLPPETDIVVCLEFIEHIEDVPGFVREIYKAGVKRIIASTPILPKQEREGDLSPFETPEAMDGVFHQARFFAEGSETMVCELHSGAMKPIYRVAVYDRVEVPAGQGAGI
jgi:2-polyprenyl-3-methyl-5-hydroxy-6-metoxy-1,4-benzoquinol methylase